MLKLSWRGWYVLMSFPAGIVLIAVAMVGIARFKQAIAIEFTPLKIPSQAFAVRIPEHTPSIKGHLVVPRTTGVNEPFVAELRLESEKDGPALSDVEFELSGTGVKIQPENQWLRASADSKVTTGIVQWSVMGASVGEFMLIVNGKFTERIHSGKKKARRRLR
jgi:hypothetical protein